MLKLVNLIKPLLTRVVPASVQQNLNSYHALMSNVVHVPTGAVEHLTVGADTPHLGVMENFYNCKGIYFSSSLQGSSTVEASLVHYNEYGNSHGSLMEAIQRHSTLQNSGYETTVKIVNNLVCSSDQSGMATRIATMQADQEITGHLEKAGFTKTEKLFVGEPNFIVTPEGKAVSKSPTKEWATKILEQTSQQTSKNR